MSIGCNGVDAFASVTNSHPDAECTCSPPPEISLSFLRGKKQPKQQQQKKAIIKITGKVCSFSSSSKNANVLRERPRGRSGRWRQGMFAAETFSESLFRAARRKH
ncbi:hypothetical protein NPIL_45441 [Nephila pilipes]|uniref:Uncharacterized protein n=1 Tax=Nephila pilipes TaxID=299642 RepID=A0A8X6P181_NEPPI|nr:hypothetical protein NPIL_45441 [Nephila pilipes]